MKEGAGVPLPCSTNECPKPLGLWPENVEAWEIFQILLTQARIGGGMSPTFTGVDLNVLPFLFDVYQIPRSLWAEYLKKINVLTAVTGEIYARQVKESQS